jgi:ABC-2 type transport system ATP-binding protein
MATIMEVILMLTIKDLTKSYGNKKALDGIDLTLPRGEIVGLFGENGAGKTTLMKAILGLHPYHGEILLDGEPITRRNIATLSFATSEHSFFPPLTAAAHRDFYREHFPRFSDKRFTGLMEFFDLPMHKPLRSFSTGQKNQFEVILALSQGADYILMDEPFAGNDIFNREDFYKVLAGILEPHETVLLSTHLIEEVSDFIGRAVLIRHGRIVGDVSVDTLEEEGKSLMDYIKETYRYRADRVSRALDDIAGKEDGR